MRIGDGAEAIIYREGDVVVKERVAKLYRLPEIDERLRKTRTRREGKLLSKLQPLGFVPRLIDADDQGMRIRMQFINGIRVRDVLDARSAGSICDEIGMKVAMLHNMDVIHADLTTSNMLVAASDNGVRLIDFGLSYESQKNEDKAVDLHLLRQALESKHHEVFEEAYAAVISAYRQHAKNAAEILKRLEQVEERGRYKKKGS